MENSVRKRAPGRWVCMDHIINSMTNANESDSEFSWTMIIP